LIQNRSDILSIGRHIDMRTPSRMTLQEHGKSDMHKIAFTADVDSKERLLKSCVDSINQQYTFIKRRGLKVAYFERCCTEVEFNFRLLT
jgi:hypothetical protein